MRCDVVAVRMFICVSMCICVHKGEVRIIQPLLSHTRAIILDLELLSVRSLVTHTHPDHKEGPKI